MFSTPNERDSVKNYILFLGMWNKVISKYLKKNKTIFLELRPYIFGYLVKKNIFKHILYKVH